MPNPPRYTLTRRILFPYSGEEPLSRKQGLRVILTWGLLFPLSMSLCTLPITAAASSSWQRVAILFLFAFLSGVFIFGSLGWIAVSMSNRAAYIRQTRRARQDQQINGGRYGS